MADSKKTPNQGKKMTIHKTRYAAQKANPSAAKIVKVDGGFIAFATVEDWQNWKRQA